MLTTHCSPTCNRKYVPKNSVYLRLLGTIIWLDWLRINLQQ